MKNNNLKRYLRLFSDYWQFTKNINFMIRMIILWFFNIIKIYVPKTEKLYYAIANWVKKDFIFDTPFGKFVGTTANQRFVMQKNYEPDLQRIIINNSKKNSKNTNNIFINIWSHVWRWAIELAKNYNYNVIAFEPSPNTYHTLRRNITLSNLEKKIKTHNIWLWVKDWNLQFEYLEQHDGWSHVINENIKYSGLWKIINVPVKRLDQSKLLSDEEIYNTRLIIIDVEWYELEVLKWMQEILNKFRNIDIIVEIFEDNKNKNETMKLMKDLWYKETRIDWMNWLFSKQ